MIARAVAAGMPFAWFTADETYGQAKWLQAWLEDQDIWYDGHPVQRHGHHARGRAPGR
jgi:hypothetical protein